MFKRTSARTRRRGAILVLSAFLMVAMLGMIAFALDIGVMMLTRTQLQVAADSAAMAAGAVLGNPNSNANTIAKQFAAYHKAGGKAIALTDADIQNGTWDATARTFTASAAVGNAIRITTRSDNTTGGNNLFFARIFGMNNYNMSASAVAMGQPRDICFVVDLSGSMNNDTEPCWSTSEIDTNMAAQGLGNIGTQMMQQVFTDFGYGTYPGTLQHVGQPLGVAQTNNAYALLTYNSGPLKSASIASKYRIANSNTEAQRKTKAYSWIIDNQIAVIMPNARPTPNSTTNYAYWEDYLDYVIEAKTVNSGTGTPPSNRGSLPPNQNSDTMDGLNDNVSAYENKIGYLTYVQFMMDMGRDKKPDGTNFTPYSTSSPNCPYHTESVGGTAYSFPPSDQPTHAMRRSVMTAIKLIKDRNALISDTNQKDWVSIVTFDTVNSTTLRNTLSSNYDNLMTSCATMQCVYDGQASTATETGLIAAKNHIKPTTQGGSGRIVTQKIVVLLTDGVANLKSSSNSTISSYRAANSSSDWYGNDYESDAALMQAMSMTTDKWRTFSVAFGQGADYDFMDRLARLGSTADDNGDAPRVSGIPTSYETELSDIFTEIITSPAVRLVK